MKEYKLNKTKLKLYAKHHQDGDPIAYMVLDCVKQYLGIVPGTFPYPIPGSGTVMTMSPAAAKFLVQMEVLEEIG